VVLLDRVRAGRELAISSLPCPYFQQTPPAADAGRHRELCNQNRPSSGVLVLYRRYPPGPSDVTTTRRLSVGRDGRPNLQVVVDDGRRTQSAIQIILLFYYCWKWCTKTILESHNLILFYDVEPNIQIKTSFDYGGCAGIIIISWSYYKNMFFSMK
jgi:hypothetical protein